MKITTNARARGLGNKMRRADPGVGTLHVHFPRAGYDLMPV